MSHYDKSYSYVEMMDAFHAGRSSMFNEQPDNWTWAMEWIDEYTKSRDKDEEIRRIDTIVEAEQEALELTQEEND